MKATKKGGDKVLPTPGTHIAVLAQVIDWGTQTDSFGSRRKVEFIFELPEETHVFDEAKGEQPLIVDRKFALTISKGSELKKAIEGINGAKLEDDEFELEELLGKACQLQLDVIEKDGYKNVSILSYMPLGKSDAKRKFKVAGETIMLDLDNFDSEAFALLPQWKQDKIKAAPEYADAIAALAPAPAPARPTAKTSGQKASALFDAPTSKKKR